MATIQELLAEVSAQTTKLASWDALMDGLRQQLADALSGVTLPPAVQAEIDKVFAVAKANTAKIDESLSENVPTEPEV